MSIVRLCPYAKDEHCKYEIYYGEPLFSKCKNCEIKIVTDMKQRKRRRKRLEGRGFVPIGEGMKGLTQCPVCLGSGIIKKDSEGK